VENIDFLDELVEKKMYRNRSDAVEASIRLLRNKLQAEGKPDAGA
jgi:Arc/MetJ-type ribon-helix-helix transcriptional regulator